MNKIEISIKRKSKKKPKRNAEMLKSTITKMKNSLEGFKGRFEQTEESANLTMEIIKAEEQ